MASSNEVKEEYASSLRDLTFNSKPLISVLTILAEENIQHAKDIVGVIENHLTRVRTEVKLPVLYLIDCIIKNVGREYTSLFCQNIVSTFCSVFEQVDEKTRSEMFKLRQTWNDVLPQKKLYALDVQIKQLDPAWPVTAPPPNNSIHLNPKFLKNAPTGVTKASTGKIVPVSGGSSVDPETLSMQQKLINKQKELLELQQRKLELELLQTQVRLQEQLKGKIVSSSTSDTKTVTSQKTTSAHSQNLLLKPGVTKELSPTINVKPSTGSNLRSKYSQSLSAMKSKLLQQQQTASDQTTTPHVAPVNSALVNAQRPTRDPRLLRLQEKQQEGDRQQVSATENVNSNVHLESKSKTTSPQIIQSENKVVTNKMSVRDNRTEPRSVSKNKSFGQGKSKTLPTRSSSPIKPSPKTSATSKKTTSKFSHGSKSSTSSASDFSGSSSSIDSPSKSKNGFYSKNRSPSKSPLKAKKKSFLVTADKEKLGQKRDDSSPRNKNPELGYVASECTEIVCNDKKSDKLPTAICKSDKVMKTFKSDSSSIIKELKPSAKNRNYMRRNREASISPEPPHDVDLRVSGPPEKHLRLQGDTSDCKSDNLDNPGMDVDLRQLPGMIGKKRPSTETADSPSLKKAKTELFDVLFGSEDTDLRQLPPVSPKIVERPKTPPPPIISEVKESSPQLVLSRDKESPKKTHLDLLRAKLASATHRDKFEKMQFSSVEKDDSKAYEDTDMRKFTSLEKVDRIFISPADEQCIKTGNMTKAQETALMNKIIAQIETQKLREAKRKESEASTVLQPISDDELDVDGEFSGSDIEDVNSGHAKSVDYGDKDDRVTPAFNQSDENFSKQPMSIDPREIRRPAWRGRRIRGTWENYPGGIVGPFRPPFRGRQDPWIRSSNPTMHPGPWRPMNSGYLRSHPYGENLGHDGSEQSQGSPNAYPTGEETPGDIVFSESIQDGVKTINIDGVPRVIRFYDETAVIFMSWDDPREISFQVGNRGVTFDDKDTFVLSFGDNYREVLIGGSPHKIRFGGPTKEIFIDGKGYECYFGSPGISIDLDGKMAHLKLDGPPPQVKIGTTKRTDLVAGRINLIVDAKIIIPVYLDCKVQHFEVNGKLHKLKFINSLKKVIIDDIVYPITFGGLPKAVILSGTKRFIRFSVLPKGIKPGNVVIKDMENIGIYDSSPKPENENSQDSLSTEQSKIAEAVIPASEPKSLPLGVEDDADRNSNDPQIFQNFISQQSFNNLDLLSNVMTTSMSSSANASSYQIEDNDHQTISDNTTHLTSTEETPKPILPPTLNINELFQKLVATGIVTTISSSLSTIKSTDAVTTSASKAPVTPAKLQTSNKIQKFLEDSKPVYFDKPETLKMRQPSLIQALYVGMQCSSCGMRFPPELSMHYSQHLDWHFRQNRKGKKNIRKAASRKWYYSLTDWKNFEEIEDIEEREKSYFENQSHVEGNPNEEEEEIEIPSVPADKDVQDACCEVCKERFEQFYNEEKEEWHLRMAIRVDGKTYHPLCHEDYLASLVDQTLLEDSKLSISHTDEEESKDNIPGLEVSEEPVVLDDDELEVIEDTGSADYEKEQTKEEPSELKEEDVEKQEENAEEEDDDDDVIIHEVIPEKIVVDDDDDEELPLEEISAEKKPIVVKEEIIDDGFVDVENGILQIKSAGTVKIKSEPIDPDELVVEDELEEERPCSSQGNIEFKPSIDGNVEYNTTTIPTTNTSIAGKIKINISKPIVTTALIKETKESVLDVNTECILSGHEICIDPSQPLPPGEEPVQLNVKPALQGVYLKKLPTVKKGTELTGLCSIM
ncbi:uncharacterized protein LOC108733341 [Agrilus planipennis]|uniref:Pre-mRNA cleavage complex 2 protein Pcf11 n=1 Tax=Agrilus planipennis TaxID=224129 RepID=A0A1W4WHK2_AGRPL|nr:uncharacterized protein LOC108733341 [Agrilus planipennis]